MDPLNDNTGNQLHCIYQDLIAITAPLNLRTSLPGWFYPYNFFEVEMGAADFRTRWFRLTSDEFYCVGVAN